MHPIIENRVRQLPPLPESALQIEAVYQNPDSSFADMVKILEKDPLLTATILKAANSPLYGFTREISSITQAVGLFGMGTIRGFALATIIKKSFELDLSAYRITNAQFSELSSVQNALAVNWYLRSNPRMLDLLSPASFLVEIGKVLISRYLIDNDLVEKFREADTTHCYYNPEKLVAEISTTEVTSAILEHWKFDEKLIELMKHAEPEVDTDEELSEEAKVLQVIRITSGKNGQILEENIVKAKELIEKYGLNLEAYEGALEKLDSK